MLSWPKVVRRFVLVNADNINILFLRILFVVLLLLTLVSCKWMLQDGETQDWDQAGDLVSL